MKRFVNNIMYERTMRTLTMHLHVKRLKKNTSSRDNYEIVGKGFQCHFHFIFHKMTEGRGETGTFTQYMSGFFFFFIVDIALQIIVGIMESFFFFFLGVGYIFQNIRFQRFGIFYFLFSRSFSIRFLCKENIFRFSKRFE